MNDGKDGLLIFARIHQAQILTKPLVLFFSLFLIACGSPSDSSETLFRRGLEKGTNLNEVLEEASGLVASRRNPGMLWTHNDSGHPPELFLLDSLGETTNTFHLSNARNRDWEDIAYGPGPDSANCLYIGDIGDNRARYKLKIVYRVKEPRFGDPPELSVVDTLLIQLADHERDTEALMVDPISRNLYLVSKREKSVWLYEVKYPFTADTLTAEKMTSLPLHEIVAGDISPDGSEIILKNYGHIYYWKRLANQSVVETLKGTAVELPYDREPMGESIAWAVNGNGFYTLGENGKGERSRLYFYARRNAIDSSVVKK